MISLFWLAWVWLLILIASDLFLRSDVRTSDARTA
jgi:hypothetical protein